MEITNDKNVSEISSQIKSDDHLMEAKRTPLKRYATTSSSKEINDSSILQRSTMKKLRLEFASSTARANKSTQSKNKYIYGNYNRYYGYRNANDFEDVRLIAFRKHIDLFVDKDVLDIGCNYGAVTMAIAKEFSIKFITGLDIDKNLIGAARKHVLANEQSILNNNHSKTTQTDANHDSNQSVDCNKFPRNISFKQCNYVLSDERLLELEQPLFDTILCLSVTKWIQLNFGDTGLKIAFKRMYKQLRPGGHLILETQNWKSYKRRKNLTPEINQNYKNIKLLPNRFEEYLLGSEVGFKKCFHMNLPEHSVKGFQRPIQVFQKGEKNVTVSPKEISVAAQSTDISPDPV